MNFRDCAKDMARITAWFMGLYTACWLLLWLSVANIADSYKFSTFGQSLIINRWFDLFFIAIHLNLIMAGLFWIVPTKIRQLDLDQDSDSVTALGCSLLIAAIVGMILVANPKLENCVTGALVASIMIFLIGIVTTGYRQSVLISAGSAMTTTFLPGILGGGALNGLYGGLAVTTAVFLVGMIPYAITKPILVKIQKLKTQTPP